MRCSRCGKCCEETEMLLSQADMNRLEKAGHDTKGFARRDKQGYVRLRNQRGYCIFYDPRRNRCIVYRHRPSGCRVYPVIQSEEEGTVADDVCPMRHTVTPSELERKGRRVAQLLKRIDREAKNACLSHERIKQS
jgi:Fe-S-cluster containining protein